MFPIRGVYEVAIRVKDLPRAEKFYREVLELEARLEESSERAVHVKRACVSA